jgi:phosphatidylinositol alpha-1,6-mannosyltransferase
MQRFTLVTLDYPPNRGGVARYLGELVKASHGAISTVMVEQNHQLTGPGQIIPREFFWHGWPRWLPMVRACREAAQHPDMTLIISHLLPMGTAAMLAKWAGGAEYVVICHGLDIRLAFGKPTKRFVASMVLRQAKQVIANSESTATTIRRLVPGVNVAVVTPGVTVTDPIPRHEARRLLGIADDEEIILSVGRLVKRKGFDLLLEATERLRDRTRLRTVIVGDGPEYASLKQLAEHLKHPVRFMLDATDTDLQLWYAAADVFCLPARESSDDVEGFGIVYLEAALHGLPVVATKSGGIAEAVVNGETGLLVPSDDLDSLVDALQRVLDQTDVRVALGDAGRRRVLTDFRWEDRWNTLSEALKRG